MTKKICTDLNRHFAKKFFKIGFFNVYKLSFILILSIFCITENTNAASTLPKITTGSIQFSHEAGFYSSPFYLVITSTDLTCKVAYTVDGSNPETSPTKAISGNSATIRINPDNNTGRGKTPGYVVRACLVKEGFSPSFSTTRTYIFVEKVKTQTAPGDKWPTGRVNLLTMDYNMASDVVNSTQYSALITPALMEIPTISLTSDLDSLFGAAKGIYVNGNRKWEDGWERSCSFEVIYPDGKKGFQSNAGMRIRGANSAKDGKTSKLGFRFFFRDEYGAKKFEFPIFGKNATSEFDCFDLRCEQNYSYNLDGDNRNLMVKDVFCRDLQGFMGQPYARGNKYHLYINGMYWGVYETDERPEASFAASYLGGDKEDYDVIKVYSKNWPYVNEATDGTMESWQQVWNLCKNGFETNQKYFALEGKDAIGKRVNDETVWVDIDNLIDYMMVIFYSGNFDAPVSEWYSDDMPNNYFAIYNTKNKSLGYKFVAHDSEHCMFTNVRNGLNQNRVNIGSNGNMRSPTLAYFQPQWIHYRLSSNAEYRLRFADRASKYLSEGGILSPGKVREKFEKRALEIDTAIIAESARWGDAKFSPSLNKNQHWLPELNNLYKNYIPYRTDVVKSQLLNEKLYTAYSAPVVSVSGQPVYEDNLHFASAISAVITNSNASGDIYYTRDGSDPRLVGGAISNKASKYEANTNINISSTSIITVRTKIGADWSPLKKTWFLLENEDYSKLKVTELAYHPKDIITGADTIDGKDLEFIEFKNTGLVNLDLSGLKLDTAVHFTFPENTILEPQRFFVVASKPNIFYNLYGVYPSGNFTGNLSNGGEYVLLTDRNGKEIFSFTYSDDSPWPKAADGSGYTLNSTQDDPTSNPNDYQYWIGSQKINGTPFTNNDGTVALETLIFENSKPSLIIYPNPTAESVTLNFGSSEEEFNVTISDLNGRVVYMKTMRNNETINLSAINLTQGIFLVKAENGKNVISGKLVYIP